MGRRPTSTIPQQSNQHLDTLLEHNMGYTPGRTRILQRNNTGTNKNWCNNNKSATKPDNHENIQLHSNYNTQKQKRSTRNPYHKTVNQNNHKPTNTPGNHTRLGKSRGRLAW